mmetsp:Transcript_14738/g.36048  ORF Transcript_14738/g.36048 Transcript_14738/m.36048 type:complete len:117 (-) Transcript_14738:1788-2138(-)
MLPNVDGMEPTMPGLSDKDKLRTVFNNPSVLGICPFSPFCARFNPERVSIKRHSTPNLFNKESQKSNSKERNGLENFNDHSMSEQLYRPISTYQGQIAIVSSQLALFAHENPSICM